MERSPSNLRRQIFKDCTFLHFSAPFCTFLHHVWARAPGRGCGKRQAGSPWGEAQGAREWNNKGTKRRKRTQVVDGAQKTGPFLHFFPPFFHGAVLGRLQRQVRGLGAECTMRGGEIRSRVSGLTSTATKFDSAGIGLREIVRGLTSAATRFVVSLGSKSHGNGADGTFWHLLSPALGARREGAGCRR
jgi:hypothetical protein